MRVVTTFHSPSSVVASVKCRLSPDGEHLVVAKPDRVEVHALGEDALKYECSLEIWGRVVSVKELPRYGSTYSNVILLTDHPAPRLYVLSLSTAASGQAELVVAHSLTLTERLARPQEFYCDVLVDPEGQVAVVSCYAGKLKVVEFDNGEYKSDFDAQFPEYNLLSMCFLPTSSDTYCLGLLHVDYEGKLQLLSRDLSLADYELFAAPSTLLPSTALSASAFLSIEPAPTLIPISASEEEEYAGGVLVVGGRKVLLYELASQDLQDKHKGKRRRLEGKKKSANREEAERAREEEKARERKRRKPRASVEWPWSEVTAWCFVDEEGKRVLLGDGFGRLALLSVDTDKPLLTLLPLGTTSPPTCLSYLNNQIFYLGSHYGDPQLLRIHPSPASSLDADTLPIPSKISTITSAELVSGAKGKGKEADTTGYVLRTRGTYVQELQSWQNVAPIIDAVVADVDGSGQRTIVTCSGGKSTGSLRVIRNGADFHELAALRGLAHVTHVWPLRSRFETPTHSHILASTPTQTHVFRIDGAEVFTSTAGGFATDTRTLAVGNLARRMRKPGQAGSSYSDSPLVVQVTPGKVILSEFDQALGTFSRTGEEWVPQSLKERHGEIVAASVNASQVVLGLSGGRLVVLNLDDNDKFNLAGQRLLEDGTKEIAAVSCLPIDPSKYYSTQVAVAFWASNEVKVLSITSAQNYLTPVCATGPLPSLPRSVLLYNFGTGVKSDSRDYVPHLLVGLADGTALAFVYKDNTLSDKRVFSFGTGPVSLTPCEVDGKRSVFACAKRSGLLFWEKQRLQLSPMLVKGVVTVAPLNSDHFPSSFTLATTGGLTIGKMGHLDKMHIRSFGLGLDNPHRIAYHPPSKVFAVACTRTEPRRTGEARPERGVLKLIDDATFEVLDEFQCDAEELISSLDVYEREDIQQPCFCVGTVNSRDEREPSSGRLLLLCSGAGRDGISRGSLFIAASLQIKGCVYAITKVSDLVAAAVNSAVVLYRLQKSSTGILTYDFAYVSEWNHDYVLNSIVPGLNGLVISDALSSVSVLDVKDSKLQRRAKDYSPLWPVAIQALDDQRIIAANVDCDLCTFSLQLDQGRIVLQKDGAFHLGELVNKFVRGSLTTTEFSGDIPIEPREIFFTSSGRIGMVFEMGSELSLHMSGLERNMGNVLIGAGGVVHSDWRAPTVAKSRVETQQQTSYGFLDGDFLEQFLSLAPSSLPAKSILSGSMEAEALKLPFVEIQHVLEKLHSMH
ncbi:hypothetical protein GLOTRDRAFT_116530 [Gloeophyllum trabeum ATCC 11539]|uniref:DNA damage-binding protein 1 n=1 Tax=Gloeophyllum trabeum (strain ATCC 11539 / FP-39264 / Madison 617) TaxID=670483 RepID=S7RPG3_GLOTA|nr:uncharacterized protein GLOTRDRAFT_116530 [Gloeophyllum trabeum ATCC 11539]EPQ54734.1 hypothetical protein GLOTRDRAFT_116530 [Gloeophyllum trabeum ATCC 11539]